MPARSHGATLNGKWSPEYRSWASMWARVRSKDARAKNYGLRGIAVCDEWKSFDRFLSDMGPRPPGLTIDRVDVNGNYEASNCRWATLKQQGENKRNARVLTFRGESLGITAWARRLGCSLRILQYRLGRKWSIEKALTTPVGKPKNNKRRTA